MSSIPISSSEATATAFLEAQKRLGIRPGLERIRALRERTALPSSRWRAIHVAGTKGKGSTVEFVRRLLLQAGYRIGAFSSPYVFNPLEQIQIGAKPVSADEFERVIDEMRAEVVRLGATEFETLTAAAFRLFDQNDVDYAVVEVGVGGREDATNILTSTVLSVLTPIGLDHQDLLGETIEEIAAHKAGILRPGVPVVVAAQEPAARAVIEEEAKRWQAPLLDVEWEADEKDHRYFSVRTPGGGRQRLHLGLPGPFQRGNAAAAVTAVDLLYAHLDLPFLTNAAVQAGLSAASLPGRYQTLTNYPRRVLFDGAHNALSAMALVDALFEESFTRLFLIVGMKRNHNPVTFLAPFAALKPAGLIATAPGGYSHSGMYAPEEIIAIASKFGIPVLGTAPTSKAAIEQALPTMGTDDLLCLCGSFALAEGLRNYPPTD